MLSHDQLKFAVCWLVIKIDCLPEKLQRRRADDVTGQQYEKLLTGDVIGGQQFFVLLTGDVTAS